jgi:hypothetical protein
MVVVVVEVFSALGTAVIVVVGVMLIRYLGEDVLPVSNPPRQPANPCLSLYNLLVLICYLLTYVDIPHSSF